MQAMREAAAAPRDTTVVAICASTSSCCAAMCWTAASITQLYRGPDPAIAAAPSTSAQLADQPSPQLGRAKLFQTCRWEIAQTSETQSSLAWNANLRKLWRRPWRCTDASCTRWLLSWPAVQHLQSCLEPDAVDHVRTWQDSNRNRRRK